MKLGSKLRRIRLQCHMTQKELARGICSQSFLSKVENNLEIPNAQILFHLCQKLDILVEQVISEPSNIIQKQLLFRKQVESLIKKRMYIASLNLLEENFYLLDYSNECDYQFYHYYKGVCFYNIDNNMVEAERNFKLASKRKLSIPYLNVTPLGILITNALAVIELEKQNFESGLTLLERSYSQISQLFESSHSDMHSKIFYNLSKCYYIQKKYDLSSKIAKEGIEWTGKFASTYFLSELYYQKGISALALNQKNTAEYSIMLSVAIAKGQHNKCLYNKIIESQLYKSLGGNLQTFFKVMNNY